MQQEVAATRRGRAVEPDKGRVVCALTQARGLKALQRSSASCASFFVSWAAGSSHARAADCPDQSEVKSLEPLASAAALSGSSAPPARGNCGASGDIGPSSRIKRLMMLRAGRPVKRLDRKSVV